MAMQAYITINKDSISKGASDPKSLGQVAAGNKDNQDKITVVAFDASALIPRDPNSGVATGSRIYQPVKFTKYFDSSSPLLWTALTTNKVIDEVLCEFFRPDSGGASKPELYYTTTWKNVTFVEGRSYTPLVVNPQNGFYQYMEDWCFTFKDVTWEHKTASKTGSDSWGGGH